MRNLLAWWLLSAMACACGAGAAQALGHATPHDVTITRGDASVTICGTWDERSLDAGAP